MNQSGPFAVAMIAAAAMAAPLTAQRPPAPLAGLDTYIEAALKEWAVAGLAVAVVKDDSVVYARGFGVREVGRPQAVDQNTLFAIGSNTKLFTAVAAGMLVDDGVLRWDAPVVSYLPSFALADPFVTKEVTVRDLLSHRTGLGQQEGNFVALGRDFGRRDVVRRIRYLKPATSFRSAFAYQNLGVLAAGEAAAAAANLTWDDLVARRILRPLVMSSTNTSVLGLARLNNVATPHNSDGKRLTPVPWRNIDNLGPAGSINSNLTDMTRWVRFLLAGGRTGDRRLLAETTLRVITSPHTILPATTDSLRPSIHFPAAGLGVMMYDYLGVKVLSHTGGIDGMLSVVSMIPERGLGVVVLSNTDVHNRLYTAIERRIVDAYLGAPEQDWSRIMLEQQQTVDRLIAAHAARVEAKRPKGTRPSLPHTAYAGRYQSDLYGDLEIGLEEDGSLTITLGAKLVGDLDHWAHDAFKVTWRGSGNGALGQPLVAFMVGPFGGAVALQVRDDLLLLPQARSWHVAEFRRVDQGVRSVSR